MTTPFQGQFVVRRLGLAMINMHTKLEVSSLSRSTHILGGLKIENGSRDVAMPISETVCHLLAGTSQTFLCLLLFTRREAMLRRVIGNTLIRLYGAF